MNTYGQAREERWWAAVEQVVQAIRVISVSRPAGKTTRDDTEALISQEIEHTEKVEAAGIEPRASHTPPDAPDTHIHTRTAHIHALPSGRDPHGPPHNAPSLHQQHAAVHDERARSVHNDPDLAVVIAAWPSLPADMRGQILALIQGQQRGEVQP